MTRSKQYRRGWNAFPHGDLDAMCADYRRGHADAAQACAALRDLHQREFDAAKAAGTLDALHRVLNAGVIL